MHRRLVNVYYEIREPRLAFDDIGGSEDVKERVRELISFPLTRGADLTKMGLVPPSGVMLWGPLGNGLTMLAEAAAREAGVTFVHVSGREMLGKPADLEEAFALALDETPCVLYVSDTDWIAPRPGADYRWPDGTERGKPPAVADPDLTRTFVAAIDRVQGRRDLALVGACYRIDMVDQAILRDRDRFNRKVFVHPPTVEDRYDMLRLFSGRFPMEECLDLRRWAEKSEGCVGWDLENVCRKAALITVGEGRERIADRDVERALPLVTPWLTPEMTRAYQAIYTADCPHHYAF